MVKIWSAADVKKEITVLVQLLKSSILSTTIFQLGKTFWRVVGAAVEESTWIAKMVAQGDGKFGPGADPRTPPNIQKNQCLIP